MDRQIYGDKAERLIVELAPTHIRFDISEIVGGELYPFPGPVQLGLVELKQREIDALTRQLDYWLTLQEHPERYSWQAVFRALVAANFDHAAAAHIADLAEGITDADIDDASRAYAASLTKTALELEEVETEEAHDREN